MDFQKVTFDETTFITPSWEQMGTLVFDLSKQIIESHKGTPNYDWVIALAKGGWTWARTLVDFLEIDNLSSIHLQFYLGIGQTEKAPKILQPLPIEVNGLRVLIFDDVADAGKTLKAAVEHVKKKGAEVVQTATLFYKPHSTVVPDFYGVKTSSWVVFPHEIREFIYQAGGDWLKKGLKASEIRQRFEELALPKDQVKYFVSKLLLTYH